MVPFQRKPIDESAPEGCELQLLDAQKFKVCERASPRLIQLFELLKQLEHLTLIDCDYLGSHCVFIMISSSSS